MRTEWQELVTDTMELLNYHEQEKFARVMGYGTSTVNKWVNGERNGTHRMAQRLVDLLHRFRKNDTPEYRRAIQYLKEWKPPLRGAKREMAVTSQAIISHPMQSKRLEDLINDFKQEMKGYGYNVTVTF